MCWGVRGDVERGVEGNMGKCVGVWGEVWKSVCKGVRECVGCEGTCGERCGGDVEKGVEV